jgi:alpha-amylase
MSAVCIYFQVHQPERIRQDYHFFKIGKDAHYFDDALNRHIMERVAEKCYMPAAAVLADLVKKYDGRFRFGLSFSGTVLEQMERYAPEALEGFKRLVRTGHVEILSETYYHSLASLFSPAEFEAQVHLHKKKIKDIFGLHPTTFRNTELIYNKATSQMVEKMGYKAILAEGADHILGSRSPDHVYLAGDSSRMKLLLKNFRLSDDLAFRFSDKNWSGYPLTASKYAESIVHAGTQGEVVSLFMDFETFGEHQWKETGIFDFLWHLPEEILKHPNFKFLTPGEAALASEPVESLSSPFTSSWADREKDTSAWIGNPLQDSAVAYAYSLEAQALAARKTELRNSWRKLLGSDHFYYMCTKWFDDGRVHNYFNPFASPYDAYVTYINVLNDLKDRF